MPAPRLVPDAPTLKKLRERGMTHQQIADYWFKETGQKVSREAISAAISRSGLSKVGHRYMDTLPWRVKTNHSKHYAARMLRLLGRRRLNLPMTKDENMRLDSWLNTLEQHQAVVAYLPNTDEGFYYTDPRPGVDGLDGVPIRNPRVP